tara:strand:- start:732 stop:1790 length:1059 start_codon:yes stop_codon:yes gene_type:complete
MWLLIELLALTAKHPSPHKQTNTLVSVNTNVASSRADQSLVRMRSHSSVECSAALHGTGAAYNKAARLLGLEEGLAVLRAHDRPYCRQLRGIVASNGEHVVYHAILKSMHSELMRRLASTTDWLSSFNVSGSCLEHERSEALLLRIEALPQRFAVVREPMSHLFSGMAQVEAYWHHPGPGGTHSLHTDTRWKDSRWRKCWTSASSSMGRPSNPPVQFSAPTLCTPVERATAMIRDMLDQSGPRAYLIILAHALPQTIGLLNTQKAWTIPLVMHSEKDADEWPVLVRNLSLGIPSTARRHTNVRTLKRDAPKFEFNESNVLRNHGVLHQAICAMLQREYACLGYGTGPCAEWL